MLIFQWPLLLWLMPFALLIWLFRSRKKATIDTLYVPATFRGANSNDEKKTSSGRYRNTLNFLCFCIIWCCLVLAAANPLWQGEPVELPSSGRDLLLAVDISGSMETPDMLFDGQSVNRLTAVKAVVSEFIERRTGDRLGLILFGTNAYLQAPLTFDRATVGTLLDEAQLGFAGEKTAIGEAIGLAIKRLRARPEASRVLILLTDGANTAGNVSPEQAARLAAAAKVKIYTIGLGADQLQVPGLLGSSFGARTINPSVDLDEKTLTHIAESTGGQYFRARNPEELQSIYALLDQLEPSEHEDEVFRPQKSLFYWPLAIALLLSLVIILAKYLVAGTANSTMQFRN